MCTADDADSTTFPLDTPILITDVQQTIGRAGKTGILAASLTAIAEQTRPLIVVIRVATGETEAETTSKLIGGTGSDGRYTVSVQRCHLPESPTPRDNARSTTHKVSNV